MITYDQALNLKSNPVENTRNMKYSCLTVTLGKTVIATSNDNDVM